MKKFSFILYISLASLNLIAQSYTNAESAEYDPVNNQWLVSNGNRIIADDGDGNLSFFGTGPGNLGIEVLGNTVFVSVGTGIVGYDLTTTEQVMNLTIPGVNFLNGLTNDNVSTLYSTSFTTDEIYAIDVSDLDNPTSTLLASNTGNSPNGILFDQVGNRLLYGTFTNPARIMQVDLSTNTVSEILTSNLAQFDGFEDDDQGNFYVSSFNPPQITRYNSDFSVVETVSTPALNSPADIGLNMQTNILAIPMFSDVIFVNLETLSITDTSEEQLQFGLSSNPINDRTFAQFNLSQPEDITLNLYDIHGRLISTLLEGQQEMGTHKVLFTGLSLSAGTYFLNIETRTGYKKSLKLIKG